MVPTSSFVEYVTVQLETSINHMRSAENAAVSCLRAEHDEIQASSRGKPLLKPVFFTFGERTINDEPWERQGGYRDLFLIFIPSFVVRQNWKNNAGLS